MSMATGDVAAAAGLTVVAGTEDIRNGYDAINERGDELGNHMLNGGHAWSKITDKPATFPPATHDHGNTYVKSDAGQNMGQHWNGSHVVSRVDGTEWEMAFRSEIPASSDKADGPTSTAYNRTATGSGYYAVWMNSSLQFMRNTSSKRYKDAIEPAAVSVADVLALEPVTFHRLAATDPDQRELGLIAEDCTEVPYLVQYEDGQPEGVAYETALPVLLLAVVKAQEARIAALEARLV